MNKLVAEGPMNAHFELSTKDFEAIAKIAQREFGLCLPVSKINLVQSRLARRVRHLRLNSFSEYKTLICDNEGHKEWPHLLSLLTTNVTKFFREAHHFDYLLDQIAPDLVARAQNGDRIRIWSAGCSSGQEPYSIAMLFLRLCPNIGEHDFKILATDIDPNILNKARKASYKTAEIDGSFERYFRKSDIVTKKESAGSEFSPSQDVRDLVTFGELNLIEKLPFAGKFDVIFCRNVAIYFDAMTQKAVWEKFSESLQLGGYLFIGHSERIRPSDHSDLEPDGVTTYRKSRPAGQSNGGTR